MYIYGNVPEMCIKEYMNRCVTMAQRISRLRTHSNKSGISKSSRYFATQSYEVSNPTGRKVLESASPMLTQRCFSENLSVILQESFLSSLKRGLHTRILQRFTET